MPISLRSGRSRAARRAPGRRWRGGRRARRPGPGPGSFANTSGTAMRASRRASGAPRQWWMPWPKARWARSPRVTSNVSPPGKRSGSRSAAATLSATASPAGMVTSPMVTGLRVKRQMAFWIGPSQRSTSSTASGQRSGSRCSRASWSGWRSRARTLLPSRLTVVSWPAESSSASMETSSSSLSRSSSSRATISAEVRSSPPSARLRATRARRRSWTSWKAAMAASRLSSSLLITASTARRSLPVLGGHVQQVPDDLHRQQGRELGGQVGAAGLFALAVQQVVEQAVRGGLDARCEGLDTAGGEALGDQGPQPGVPGRVGDQHGVAHADHHVAGDGDALLAEGGPGGRHVAWSRSRCRGRRGGSPRSR